ncbi:MAG: ABC transporter ATP-binding protein [Armatimonadetes bacterium]|nr:ABC transporter ATP-binding protein [Armatimonadota bacterium]
MQFPITASDLTKVYRLARGGRKTAVDCLTLDVRPGEIFGFLGPNGAGKTTTIKMLLGFIRPTSGRAEILGVPVDDPQARAPVGYLPEQPYFHKFMTPVEIISMHAALIGVDRRGRKQDVIDSIEMVGLQELARIPVSKLSKGQVQRVGIAQALLGGPGILILDEPASGLDPLGRRQVRDLLVRQRELGRTVFLSSHLLSEIETVCDRVAVLSRGRLVAVGTPEQIKRGESRMAVTTDRLTSEVTAQVIEIGGQLEDSEGETVIRIDSGHIYQLIELLREAGLPLISVEPDRESLEEAFLRLAA